MVRYTNATDNHSRGRDDPARRGASLPGARDKLPGLRDDMPESRGKVPESRDNLPEYQGKPSGDAGDLTSSAPRRRHAQVSPSQPTARV